MPAKISLAQVPFSAKRIYPFWCTLVTSLAPARDWLVPLLGFADERDGGELPMRFAGATWYSSIYSIRYVLRRIRPAATCWLSPLFHEGAQILIFPAPPRWSSLTK